MSDKEARTAIKITIGVIVVFTLALVPVIYWVHNSGKRMRGGLTSEAPA